jgi:hypothetical protein
MRQLYVKLLKDVPQVEFLVEEENLVPWFIEIAVDNPVELAEYLKSKNIGTRAVYPPINTQLVYSNYNNLKLIMIIILNIKN